LDLHTDSVRKLSFLGRFASLAPIAEFVGRAAEAAGLDERAIYAVQLAVDEASTNIIEYSYGGEGRGEIEITCRISSDGLTVILRDGGLPFDPERVPSPNLHATLEERDAGGLGVYLMRQLMDEVHFHSAPDSGNTLTLVKLNKAPSRNNAEQEEGG
jgi:serine/threonine-protein kinase RsbW